MTSGMYTQMMDIREELREGSRDRRIPDDPVTDGQMTLKKREEGPKSDRTRMILMILAHLISSA